VTIVPAEDGLQADAESLAVRLTTVLKSPQERRAELTMHRAEPEITTAEAQAMGIVERISTFTTDYAASNKPRVNNIHILADALDGTLIPPGGVFSFNETIGPRTAEKGYQEANAIVNGKLVPQLGGGICQVGTTIFNTVFFSGLPVIERKNHSQYISHYPTGRDATVSWGGPDFKFKNDTPNWVLVATGYTNSTVTISLYGTNPKYQVTYDTGAWTDIKDPAVKEVPDPTMPAGSRVIEERGVSGRTIIVVRHVLQGGVEIRKDTFKSVYKPAEEVVRVGTGSSVPTTTTP
jgi:vancomycin resistance protein YoaR